MTFLHSLATSQPVNLLQSSISCLGSATAVREHQVVNLLGNLAPNMQESPYGKAVLLLQTSVLVQEKLGTKVMRGVEGNKHKDSPSSIEH